MSADATGQTNGNSTPKPQPRSRTSSTGGMRLSEKKLADEYKLGDVLGQGAYGVVHACTKIGEAEKDAFAVKMIDRIESPLEAIKRETDMMQKLVHPNVVRLHAVFWEKCFVCVVMDRWRGGDLIEGMQKHWSKNGRIPTACIPGIARQITASIAYLHEKGIAHRDIKGDNYLIDRPDITDPHMVAAVADFGTAREVKPNERMTTSCGTKVYWAPEFFKKEYGLKVDVWAAGVLCYGLVHARFPFKGDKDACGKEPPYAKDLPPVGLSFLQGVLHKEESQRLSAADAAAHPWLAADSGDAAKRPERQTTQALEDFASTKEERCKREDGPGEGIRERRRDLIQQLHFTMERQRTGINFVKHNMDRVLTPSFTNPGENLGESCAYAWRSADSVDLANFLLSADQRTPSSSSKAGTGAGNRVSTRTSMESLDMVGQMLGEHGIDVSAFGRGAAKTLQEFSAELESGASRLMLDAREHKKLVRVVDVVLLRLCFEIGTETCYLVESHEKYKDGRIKALNKLPGTKKEPHESAKQVAMRLLQKRLRLHDCEVDLTLDTNEVFEDEEESPSYPGVLTVYCKEVVTGTLKGGKGLHFTERTWFSEDAAGGTRWFSWSSSEECQKLGIPIAAEQDENFLTCFVRAPFGFSEEEELQRYLRAFDIDTSQYGKETGRLKELLAEVSRGKSALVEQQKPDGPGKRLVRLVDVVLLRLERADTGELLVELPQEGATNGASMERPPATKRQPDENQFLAAKRLIRKRLLFDENWVNFQPGQSNVVEEESPSSKFPGLVTVYRKTVLSAKIEAPNCSPLRLPVTGGAGGSGGAGSSIFWLTLQQLCCGLNKGANKPVATLPAPKASPADVGSTAAA
eukprot:TRINITY_DN45025_c0_g1_i1.p1 TRINITY_DN45025_c0_g1~~TRINITY_DN45025_c0_g1_i1.p1  ORF type:complete len:862 (+),score=212.26 TRINITY_DN45025_c0_g1_i1:119-2704(+)